jgi:hypothetical protein
MNFHRVFYRYLGGGGPPGSIVLGTDTVLTRAPTGNDDNIMFSNVKNIDGWPVHRVAVGYVAPTGTAALPATGYIWEAQLGAWLQVGPAGTLTPGQVTFFDTVALIDSSVNQSGLDQGSPSRGNLAFMLIVGATGAPNGVHKFAIGADLSTAT